MCGYSAKPLDKIRVGIVGLGNRGKGAVKRLARLKDVEIGALCDLRAGMVAKSQAILKKAGRPEAKAFSGTEDVWKDMVAFGPGSGLHRDAMAVAYAHGGLCHAERQTRCHRSACGNLN